MAQWQNLCESFPQYLSAEQAQEMSETGTDALTLYLAASAQAVSMSTFAWLVIPKMHVFDHICQDTVRDLYNVRWFHNFGGEDFMGILKTLCCICAGRGMATKVLRRTLLRLAACRVRP